jgi:nitrilase
MPAPFTVAVVQAAPVFLDLPASLDRACALIAEAAGAGARLVLFPEAYLPGYPDWVWVAPPGSQKPIHNAMNRALMANAVTVPDANTRQLCQAARKAKVIVAMGLHERNTEASGASLYNTLLVIDARGEIIARHRKLMPTGGERLVWAQGDGSSLRVQETDLGRLGGLICWENFMPLARQALYNQGEQIHLAPTWDSSDGWRGSMQHIAREGGMFVLSCCMALRMDELPDSLPFKALYPEDKTWVNRGGSCIVDPLGKIIAGPLLEAQGILTAELDLGLIAEWKWMFDAAGHYARPDVFRFSVPAAEDSA